MPPRADVVREFAIAAAIILRPSRSLGIGTPATRRVGALPPIFARHVVTTHRSKRRVGHIPETVVSLARARAPLEAHGFARVGFCLTGHGGIRALRAAVSRATRISVGSTSLSALYSPAVFWTLRDRILQIGPATPIIEIAAMFEITRRLLRQPGGSDAMIGQLVVAFARGTTFFRIYTLLHRPRLQVGQI